MAEAKTKPTEQSVEGFLNTVSDQQKREDCFSLLELMKQATQTEPQMWGSSIVGFGSYHYIYASGRSGDAPLTGFSPRKQNLVLYLMGGFDQYDELLRKLGKHTVGKSCLYIKRLADVDLPTLKTLVQQSFSHMRTAHAPSQSG
jgi:hypothetical protein